MSSSVVRKNTFVALSILSLFSCVSRHSGGDEAAAPKEEQKPNLEVAAPAPIDACLSEPDEPKCVGHSPVNKNLDPDTAPFRTINLPTMEHEDPQTGYGFYGPEHLITPISALAIRSKKYDQLWYAEAETYDFLINNPKFPNIVRMDDGTIVLSISGVVDSSMERTGFLLKSTDGESWTTPIKASRYRYTLANLGGNKLLLVRGSSFEVTSNYGKSFYSGHAFPKVNGKTCETETSYSPLIVKNHSMNFVCWTPIGSGSELTGELFTRAFLLRFSWDTGKWEEPQPFPPEWGLNEGALIVADNGDWIAAFRTQVVGIGVINDHYMGLATSISHDQGKTWSLPVQHFTYGRMHINLIKLKNGNIMMTYAVRAGELEGKPFHGVEAVVSSDNGKTWDWDHRYILARWPNSTMHSASSAELNDGRILTVFMHDTFFSWSMKGTEVTPSTVPLSYTGNVTAVIWTP